MTLEQIQALTDDEIRERVAELCGWKNVHRFDKWKEGGTAAHKDGDLVGDFDSRTRSHLPNYPADLKACAEMEESLAGRWPWYLERLDEICERAYPEGNQHCREHQAAFAKARQRCEAFLATMGKDTP